MFTLAAHTAKNYLQNRTTYIQIPQQSSPKIPAGAHHHQKANTKKICTQTTLVQYCKYQKIKHKTFTARSFKYAAPTTWNSPRNKKGHATTLPSLNHYLKLICTKNHSTLNKLYKPSYPTYNSKFRKAHVKTVLLVWFILALYQMY